MYSGQAAVAQTAMSMSSMPGLYLMYFHSNCISVYITRLRCICVCICISSSTRYVPDVGDVSGRVGSDLRGHQLLLPGLLLPPRLRHAQFRHRGHDLVHHKDGLSLIPGVCVFLL